MSRGRSRVSLQMASDDMPSSDYFSAVRLTENEIASLTEDLVDYATRELGMSFLAARKYAHDFVREYRARLSIAEKQKI